MIKLGFTGVYIIFLISAQNIDCGYSLELPHRGSSNEYPQSMFWAETRKILAFLTENFPFLGYKIFNIFELGFTGVYIIFLISAQKHRLWVLVRTEVALTSTHNLCFEQNYEKYQRFFI